MQTELRLFWGKASAINNKKLTFEPQHCRLLSSCKLTLQGLMNTYTDIQKITIIKTLFMGASPCLSGWSYLAEHNPHSIISYNSAKDHCHLRKKRCILFFKRMQAAWENMTIVFVAPYSGKSFESSVWQKENTKMPLLFIEL